LHDIGTYCYVISLTLVTFLTSELEHSLRVVISVWNSEMCILLWSLLYRRAALARSRS